MEILSKEFLVASTPHLARGRKPSIKDANGAKVIAPKSKEEIKGLIKEDRKRKLISDLIWNGKQMEKNAKEEMQRKMIIAKQQEEANPVATQHWGGICIQDFANGSRRVELPRNLNGEKLMKWMGK